MGSIANAPGALLLKSFLVSGEAYKSLGLSLEVKGGDRGGLASFSHVLPLGEQNVPQIHQVGTAL